MALNYLCIQRMSLKESLSLKEICCTEQKALHEDGRVIVKDSVSSLARAQMADLISVIGQSGK